MKKLLFLISLLVLGGLFYIGGLRWWIENSKSVGSDEAEQRFVVPKGYSASQISSRLEEQGLIKSALAFKIFVQVKGLAKKIQAGEYDVSPSLSLSQLVDKLTHGPNEVWVTIPEGLRREEIVERFIVAFGLSSNQANIFRVEFLGETEGKEGFLFPETYLFPKTSPASLVAQKLIQTFDIKVDEKVKNDIDKTGYSLDELVTLASMIERETLSSAERPVVAGILIKRLEYDWPLQVDATLQYAIAGEDCEGKAECNWWPLLSGESFETSSPYNTYKYTGFPPAPIASPGLTSIKAAVYPEESDYWYYLHSEDGEIHYARTLEEHNRNKRDFLGR